MMPPDLFAYRIIWEPLIFNGLCSALAIHSIPLLFIYESLGHFTTLIEGFFVLGIISCTPIANIIVYVFKVHMNNLNLSDPLPSHPQWTLFLLFFINQLTCSYSQPCHHLKLVHSKTQTQTNTAVHYPGFITQILDPLLDLSKAPSFLMLLLSSYQRAYLCLHFTFFCIHSAVHHCLTMSSTPSSLYYTLTDLNWTFAFYTLATEPY